MKTIEEFCNQHKACSEGRQWAMEHCSDMNEAFQTAKYDWCIWIATQPGVLTDKELRLFAVWCIRQIEHLLNDKRSNAINVAEKFAHGNATIEELDAARADAWDAQLEYLRKNTMPDFS